MRHTDPFEPGDRPRFPQAAGRIARRLVPLIYIISVLAFIADVQRDNTLAYGIIYTPLVATAVFHRRHRGLWLLTAGACTMVAIGALLPNVSHDLTDEVANRVLSVLAIMATAMFVHHARGTQDRLAAQTRRAEAAERIKSQVLTDLSEQIRTPLHSLLGVLTLTMLDSTTGQREALGQVRSGAMQLLATVDNLIDLAQVEDRPLRRQPVDLVTIARDAAETAESTARVRQVTVAMASAGEAGETTAIGDSWAIRRILDNLLANAVRLTPPGGAVSVRVSRHDRIVTASVSDTGCGLPPEVTLEFHEDAPATDGSSLPEKGGAGLALSSRLARTMNGRVTAHNDPDCGATVSLSLPAA